MRHDPDANHEIDLITVPLLALLSVLTFMGLGRTYRERGPTVAAPYAIFLIFFPLIYYLTHVGGWYRCPMDPIILTLGAYEVHSCATAWVRRRRAVQAAFEPAVLPARGDEVPGVRLPEF